MADFRDGDELARTLPRERAKDMATDYTRRSGSGGTSGLPTGHA